MPVNTLAGLGEEFAVFKKRRVASSLLILLLFLFILLQGMPGRIDAVDYVYTKVETSRLVSWFSVASGARIVVPIMSMQGSGGLPAYCLTPHADEPYPGSAVQYRPAGAAEVFGNPAFIQGVTAIIQHGYPGTATFNGVTYAADQAQYATNVAIWWLHASLGLPGGITPISGAVSNGNESLFAVARQLYEIGRSQAVRTLSVVVSPASWVFRMGGLECSAQVTSTNMDSVAISSVPDGISASLSGGVLQLRTTDLSCLSSLVSVGLTGFSSFANENLFWLAPDLGSYQTVVAVSSESRFSASAVLTPEIRTGSLAVRKTDSSGLLIQGTPAIFQLIAADTGNACGFVRTAEGRYLFGGGETSLATHAGVLNLAGIPDAPGGWRLREISAPPGYLPMETDLEVLPGSPEAAVNVANQYEMVKIRVVKSDAETGRQPQGEGIFAGARFEVWHKNYDSYEKSPDSMKDIVVIPAGSDHADSKLLRGGRQPGFFVREIAAPEGYLISPEVFSVTPGQSGNDPHMAAVTVADQVIRGRIAIEKRGERMSMAESDREDTLPLAGVSFAIRSSATGKIVQTMVTETSGKAVSGPLPYGRYSVEEIAGEGNLGYTLSAPSAVTVSENDSTIRLMVTNTAVRTPVSIRKVDAVTGEWIRLPGSAFCILDADGQRITFPDGAIQGARTDVLTADSDGNIVLPEGLVPGDYAALEITPPAGYALNSRKIPFAIGMSGDPVLVEIQNAPTRVEIRKTGDPDGTALAGAGFQLAHPSGEVIKFDHIDGIHVPADTGSDVLMTGDDGCIRLARIPAGDYLLMETLAPAGYRKPESVASPIRVEPYHGEANALIVEVKNERIPREPDPTPSISPSPVPSPAPEPSPVPSLSPSPTPTPEPTETRMTEESLPVAPPIPVTGERLSIAVSGAVAAALLLLLIAKKIRNASTADRPGRPDPRNRRPL